MSMASSARDARFSTFIRYLDAIQSEEGDFRNSMRHDFTQWFIIVNNRLWNNEIESETRLLALAKTRKRKTQ